MAKEIERRDGTHRLQTPGPVDTDARGCNRRGSPWKPWPVEAMARSSAACEPACSRCGSMLESRILARSHTPMLSTQESCDTLRRTSGAGEHDVRTPAINWPGVSESSPVKRTRFPEKLAMNQACPIRPNVPWSCQSSTIPHYRSAAVNRIVDDPGAISFTAGPTQQTLR